MTGPLLWLIVGCPKSSTGGIDPALPEEVAPIEARAPMALLETGADSLEPGQRARALALLVENGDVSRWGQRALLDPSDWVRRAAVEALGERGDEPSRALLEGVAGDADNDPYLRAMAALRAPGPAAAAAMTAALATEREAWRVAPLALAALRLGDEGAREVLLRALATGELALDLAFVKEIGQSGDAALVPALEQGQERAEDELILPLAAARLMLGDATAEQALRKALGDADEEQRLEAMDYLVELDHPAAITLLRKASAEGPDLVGWYADLALAAHDATDADVFERAFADPDRELRALAVRFAGEAAGADARRIDKVAKRIVVEGLADPDARVRIEACRAAAALRLEEARAGIERLLTDEVELVRIEASGALLALDQP